MTSWTPPPKILYTRILIIYIEVDIQKLSAQKIDQNPAQTHLFEAKDGSKKRKSGVDPIERKLSTTSKEQQDKVEKNNSGKLNTNRGDTGQSHYKKEGSVGHPNKEESAKTQREEKRKIGVDLAMDKDKSKNAPNPNKRDLSFGSTWESTPKRNSNKMEAKRELDRAFSNCEGKDEDSYEEYGAVALNQKEFQDISSHLSRNHGDESDTQSLGITAPLSEAQSNIQMSQMLKKLEEMSRSVEQGFVRVQNVTMETNKTIALPKLARRIGGRTPLHPFEIIFTHKHKIKMRDALMTFFVKMNIFAIFLYIFWHQKIAIPE